MIDLGNLGDSGRVRDDIAEITKVALNGVGGGMRHSGGIEMPAGRGTVWRGTIALFVNMKAVWARLEAGDLAVDVHTISGSAEVNGALRDVALGGVQNYDTFGGLLSDGGAATKAGSNQNSRRDSVRSPFHMCSLFLMPAECVPVSARTVKAMVRGRKVPWNWLSRVHAGITLARNSEWRIPGPCARY